MRGRTFIAIVFLVLGSFGCMKKTKLENLQSGNLQLNFSDPRVGSVDCPNGVTFGLDPISGAHKVGVRSSFKVWARGCKNGYSVSYGSRSYLFGGGQTDQTQTYYSEPILVDFFQPGSNTVSMQLNALNSNASNPQIVRAFEVKREVIVDSASPLTCSVTPSIVFIPQNQQQAVRLTFTTSAPAKLVSVAKADSSTPDGDQPLVASPDLSNEVIPSTLSSIEKEISLRGKNGVVVFTVQDGFSPSPRSATCFTSVTALTSLQSVNADFDGDGTNDTASLYKLPNGGAYQLQVSFIRTGDEIVNSISSINLPSSETYEGILAGDIDKNGKADLVFYRKEGTPAVGKFRIALSTVVAGNSIPQFTLFELAGSWPNNLLLEDRTLDLNSSPPRILGKIGTQSYSSNLVNVTSSDRNITSPVLIEPTMNLTASPSLTVASTDLVTISFRAIGFARCDLFKCNRKSATVCDSDLKVSSFTSDGPQYSGSYILGTISQNTSIYSSCFKPNDSVAVPNRIELTVNNPAPPTPTTPPAPLQVVENFDGLDGVFQSADFNLKVGSFNRVANRIASMVKTAAILVSNKLQAAADVRVEADINVAQGAAAGLLARYQGPHDTNGYLGQIYNGYGQIWKSINGGGWTLLDQASVPTSNKSIGKLVFEVVGTQLVLTFNGAHVVSFVDSSNPIVAPGVAGLRSGGSDGSTFDNFKASNITIPAGTIVSLPYQDQFQGPDGLFLSGALTQQLGRIHRSGEKITSIATPTSILSLNGLTAQNVRVSARVSNLIEGTTAELIGRYTGSGDRNCYMGRLYRSGGYTYAQLYLNQGGTWLPALATKNLGRAITGGLLSLSINGNQLELKLDGVSQLTATNSVISNGGSVGIRFHSSGAFIDDFEAVNLTP